MTIASIGAFILSDYTEGTAVMLFYQVGELFQSYAVGNSRKSIAALMDIRPDYANIEKDGEIVSVDPDEVEIGSTIIVKPGERIPPVSYTHLDVYKRQYRHCGIQLYHDRSGPQI